MTTAVEAQSLSGLTNLLANPPQYPRNPTHRVHDPLILYIVRVPGSRDVFLTPVKPPTKTTVSLDAINSSLYYFHVETPEDQQIIASAIDDRRVSVESQRSVVSIARKPLSSLAEIPPLPPQHKYVSSLPPRGLSHTRDVGNTDGIVQTPAILHVDTSTHTIHRKPVYNAATPDSPYAPIQPSTERNTGREQLLVNTRIASCASSSSVEMNDCDQSSTTNAVDFRPCYSLTDHTYDSPTVRITVIRRDPASGSQWNVGFITQLKPTFPGSTLNPIAIDLITPGYTRFSKQSEVLRPSSAGSDAASIRRAMYDAGSEPQYARGEHSLEDHFRRIVDFQTMTQAEVRTHVHQRTDSRKLPLLRDLPNTAQNKHVLQFTSPWYGTCSFVNAIDGKSLKVKHTISSTTSVYESVAVSVAELRFNLFSNLFNTRSYSSINSEPEHLPIPRLLESKKENFRRSLQDFRHRSWEKRRSKQDQSFSYEHDPLRDLSNIPPTPSGNIAESHLTALTRPRYHARTHSETSSSFQIGPVDDDTSSRISLRLGREKAGGGFRGQSAKLGKLIIENEGLKMCDLVVSACMGVWWQHYDK